MAKNKIINTQVTFEGPSEYHFYKETSNIKMTITPSIMKMINDGRALLDGHKNLRYLILNVPNKFVNIYNEQGKLSKEQSELYEICLHKTGFYISCIFDNTFIYSSNKLDYLFIK